jgi:type II secretory pathway pseudopilin PulG
MTPNLPLARRRKEAGYTLLMVVFMVASMLIVAMAAAPNILTQGRREKEEEMVWRGKQYARAISLYYHKFGKYPTKIDDLVKQTNGVRFLRHAYTDPMNKEDGSWRFIYVGPNGQLIGSLRQTSLLQTALTTPGLNGALGAGMQPPAPPPGPNQGAGTGQLGQQPNPATAANPLDAQPQPLTGDVLGGSIAGVGSKIKKPSIRVYLGGDTYEMWEFIYNPLLGQGQFPGGIPAPVNPNGGPAPFTPGTTPQAPTPNPNGQPTIPTAPTQ